MGEIIPCTWAFPILESTSFILKIKTLILKNQENADLLFKWYRFTSHTAS
ncbi:hypothetical protein Leryth_021976 [Lithospermum erythrorhizon]|nr:hypothetical protein Leryth_021976 [Lithospermum erythrorhizon]